MDADDIVALFATFGRVSVRRMFGGFGIYADGAMFALASRGVVYLKADDESAGAFRQEGADPFTYDTKHGRHASLLTVRLPRSGCAPEEDMGVTDSRRPHGAWEMPSNRESAPPVGDHG